MLVEVEIEVIIEIDDEGFVLGIAGLHESDSRFVNAWTLVAHAPAVIDDQSHADRNIFALEYRELLLDLVFENAKIFRLEAISKALAVIDDGRVQHDQVHVNLDTGTLSCGVRILARGRRRRRGYRNLSEDRASEHSGSAYQEKQTAQARNETPEDLSDWGRSIRSWNRR